MSWVHVVRSWFRRLFDANSADKKLFVEQLEDRCFLSAVPINDGGVAAVDPVPDTMDEEREPPPGDREGDHPEEELDPRMDVERISPLALPDWAKAEIVESSGEFVEAFQLDDQGTVVHFRDSSGDSKVLYRDSSLVREVSLTDVIVNRLDNAGLEEQALREIDDLNVNLTTRQTSQQVRIEGLATLESPDGTTLLVGFTLQFRTPTSPQTTRTPPSFIPPQNSLGNSAHSTESTNNPKIEIMGPQPRKPLLNSHSEFEDQLAIEFWSPQSLALEIPESDNLTTIPPQQLLPSSETYDQLRWEQDLRWPGGTYDSIHDDPFANPYEFDPYEDSVQDLIPPNEMLQSQLGESAVGEDLIGNVLDDPASQSSNQTLIDESEEPERQPLREEKQDVPRHQPKDAWPNDEQQQLGEDDEDSSVKRDTNSPHVSDLNAFNAPRTQNKTAESDTDETASAESSLPKSHGRTKQEPQ